jgi:hypothetical protein
VVSAGASNIQVLQLQRVGSVGQWLSCPLRVLSTTHFPVRRLCNVIYHGQMKEIIVVL